MSKMDELSVALVTYWWSYPEIENRESTFWISQMLLEHKIHVDVITARRIDRKEKDFEKHGELTIFRYLSFTTFKIIPFSIKRLLFNNYKCFHGFAYGSAPAAIAFYASKINNIPFIFTPFGSWHDQPQSIKFYLRKWYDKTIGHNMLKNSTLILAKSNYEKKLYDINGISNVIVMPEAIDTKFFKRKEIKYDLKKIYNSNNIVLSVGGLNPRKRHDITIKLFKKVCEKIPDARLIIVGKEYDAPGHGNYLQNLIKSLGLEKSVFLTGYLTRDQLIDAYLSSKVFLLLSRYESFGIVFIEAMAAGLPIIAPDIPPLNEIISHERNGILIPENQFHTIPDIIGELLTDESKIKSLSLLGKEIVEKQYDISVLKKRMWNIYEKLIFR